MWRAKCNAVLPELERFSDGSFRSELVASTDRYARNDVVSVRVIEYAINDPKRRATEETRYRLLTTILDPNAAPAEELAALHSERWEIESIFDEMKTHQRGPRVILRSKTPTGVYQEAWGYLCVHYAIRALIHQAADHKKIDPDKISFTNALHATRRSVRRGLDSGNTLAMTAHRAITEILHRLLPERRLRSNARVIRRKMSNFGVKRAAHRRWPQPALAPAAAIRILGPP